jgi:hypothetical protein
LLTGGQTETTFRSDFVGNSKSVIESGLREKGRLFEQAPEMVAENAIYFSLAFSASPKGSLKCGF